MEIMTQYIREHITRTVSIQFDRMYEQLLLT